MSGDRPQPRETADNAPMLAAWRDEAALLLQRCIPCGHVSFYPRAACPACWSDRLSWFKAAGTGRIVSFSRVHRGLPPVFQAEAPVVLAEVALPEGALMIARVVTAEPEAVHSGMTVRLLPREAAQPYPLPTFQPG